MTSCATPEKMPGPGKPITLEESIRGLKCLFQPADVVLLRFQTLQNALVGGVIHLRFAAENPEVCSLRVPHDRVLVIGAQIDNPVVAGERPEKADFEFGICALVDHPGSPSGASQFSIQRFVPAL